MLDIVPPNGRLASSGAIGAIPSTDPAAGSLVSIQEILPVLFTELHVFGTPEPGDAEAFSQRFGLGLPEPRRAVFARGRGILSIGPTRWLLMSAPTEGEAEALWPQERGAIIRQMQGRTLIRLSGGGVRSVLAKGTSIDLDPSVFAPGACSATALARVAITLIRTGEEEYAVVVARSYARWLWDWILLNSREFNPRILPAQPLQ